MKPVGSPGISLIRSLRLQFLEVGAVVLADAQEFLGIGHRRQVIDRGKIVQRAGRKLCAVGVGIVEQTPHVGEPALAQREQLFHRRRDDRLRSGLRSAECLVGGGEIEHLVAEQDAEAGLGRIGLQAVGGESHCRIMNEE